MTGPGELWMQADDSVVAQNIHETILEAMKALKELFEFEPRSRRPVVRLVGHAPHQRARCAPPPPLGQPAPEPDGAGAPLAHRQPGRHPARRQVQRGRCAQPARATAAPRREAAAGPGRRRAAPEARARCALALSRSHTLSGGRAEQGGAGAGGAACSTAAPCPCPWRTAPPAATGPGSLSSSSGHGSGSYPPPPARTRTCSTPCTPSAPPAAAPRPPGLPKRPRPPCPW